MPHRRRIILGYFSVMGFALALPACSTLETSADLIAAPFDFTSSTSETSWFSTGADAKAQMFVTVNYDNLAQDMARGGGEYVASLGTLLGVPRDHLVEFSIRTQEQCKNLFSSERPEPKEMLTALRRTVGDRFD